MDLTGVGEKFRRSLEHYDSLQEAITGWVFEQGYHFVDATQDSDGDSSYILTVKPLPVPLRIPAIFGDVVHNLRSALDHFARQLLLASDAEPDDGPGGTVFPIRVKAPSSGSDLVLKARSGDISNELKRVLDAVQPYHWGSKSSEHPLALLNALDIIDKHRMLHTTVLNAEGGSVTFGAPDGVIPSKHHVLVREGQETRVAVDPVELHDGPLPTGTWKITLGLLEPTVDQGIPLDGIVGQLAVHVAGEVILRFMDCMHPGLPTELAREMVVTGVIPGSFQDEIANIATRGWHEPELDRE